MNYITITTSDGVAKKYKAVGFKPDFQKNGTAERLPGGVLDVTSGSTYKVFHYQFRVRDVEPEAGFGTYDNLKALIELSRPNATPSNCFSLTDHYGDVHAKAFIVGNVMPEPLTTILEGEYGLYVVPIDIHVSA